MPQEIVNSVSDVEKRRQEAINEVMYTERDFVRDMEYLRDVRIILPFCLECTDRLIVGVDRWAEGVGCYSTATTHRLFATSVLEHTRHHSRQHAAS